MQDRTGGREGGRRHPSDGATRARRPLIPLAVLLLVSSLGSALLYRDLIAAWPAGRIWEPGLRDADQFIWSMRATPARLRSLGNPFLSEAIFARDGGANLAYNTAAPGVALLALPATWVWGPAAAVTVVTLLLPPITALAGFHLLRVIAPAAPVPMQVLGASMIAFCPSVVLRNGHHVNLAAAVPLVLVAGALAARAAASIGRGQVVSVRTGVLLGVVTGSLSWVSTEVLALSALATAVPGVVLLLIDPLPASVALQRLRRSSRAVAAGVGTALLVSAPFWVAFLLADHRVSRSYHEAQRHLFGIRLENLLFPTGSAWPERLAGLGLRSESGPLPAEAVGYLSAAGIAGAVVVTAGWRSRRVVRFAVVGFWLSVVLSLGGAVHTGRSSWGWLPWRLVEPLPLIGDAVPNRLALFSVVYLVVALVALGATTSRSTVRRSALGITVAMAVFMLPAVPFDVAELDAEVGNAISASCGNADVLVVPADLGFGVFVGPRSMAWQAEAGMRFDLIRGWAFRGSSPAEGPASVLDRLAVAGAPAGADIRAAEAELEELAPVCVVAPAVHAPNLQHAIERAPTAAADWRIWHVP